MKEFSPINQGQLTTQLHAPKLEIRGDIFMPEPGTVEVVSQRQTGSPDATVSKSQEAIAPFRDKASKKSEHPAQENSKDKNLRGDRAELGEEWEKAFAPEQLSNPAIRLAIESAIAKGYGPADKAGKLAESSSALDVVKNSLLSEQDRIEKAKQILGRELSFKEQEALLKAHNTGAGVFENSMSQLEEKVKILEKEGFSKDEIRTIIEAGLAAAPSREKRLEKLVGEINKYIADKNSGIDDPVKRQELVNKLLEVIKTIAPQAQIDQSIIDLVVVASVHLEAYKPLDYLFTRIISSPLDAETSNYSLGFYAQNNLEAIRGTVRSALEQETDPQKKTYIEAQSNKIGRIYEAIQYVHGMNKEIVTGDLEGFINVARVITPEQLQALQDVKGVALVMRLFESEFQRAWSKSKSHNITQDIYEEIIGAAISKKSEQRGTGEIDRTTGEERKETVIVTQRGVGSVEELLRDINAKNPSEKQLDEWEIRWALNVGKDFFNITLRAAEQISLGTPGTGYADEQFASFPQESAAKIMNWMGWMGKRFEPGGKGRGSVVIMDKMIENYQNDRSTHGYKDINLTAIGGQTVSAFEYAGMFGVSGIWSTWRQNLILLEHAPMSGEDVTIRQFLDRGKGQSLESLFLDANGRLKDGFSNALGILLKQGIITPVETDTQDAKDAKEEIRIAIWKKVAEDNPLAIASFINGSKTKSGSTIYLTDDGLEKGETKIWDSLTQKLSRLHEIRMQRVLQGKNISLKDLLLEEAEGLGIRLSLQEVEMLEKIQENGKNLASEFANIRFPFTPFMNDVLYETAEYGEAGAEFYRRRTAGDLPSFNGAYGEIIKLIDNPGGLQQQAVLEIMHKIVQALGSPQGTAAGQDKIVPIFEAWLSFIEEGGQHEGDIKKWLAKQAIYSGIEKNLHKPNSLAQKYAGMGAMTVNESETLNILQAALNMGILRRGEKDKTGKITLIDIYNKIRKKHGGKTTNLILAILRDWLIFAGIGLVAEFSKETYKSK